MVAVPALAPAVTGKLWLESVAGIVTLAGTGAMAASLLARFTVWPAAPAAVPDVTVSVVLSKVRRFTVAGANWRGGRTAVIVTLSGGDVETASLTARSVT